MSYEVVVGVVDSADDLLEEEPCIFLADLIELDVVVQFASLGQLHDDEYVVAGVQDLVKLDDIVVVDELEDSYFPFDLNQQLATLDIMCLLFILRLFIILTATRTPVRSCRASSFIKKYISPSQILLFRWSFPECSVRYAPHPSKYIINNSPLPTLVPYPLFLSYLQVFIFALKICFSHNGSLKNQIFVLSGKP